MRGIRAIIGLVGVAAVAMASWWWLAPGDPIRRAESALGKGRWAEVVAQSDLRLKRNPADPRARVLRARGLANLGRSADSRKAYLAAGADLMEPADFLALGLVLGNDGRDALATVAIEAAGRIDPKDANVGTARASLRARAGRKGEVAHVADHLASVPGGRALGELVVSLAALATGDSSADLLMDRVLLSDRLALRAIDSPLAARRMIARSLLEVGRPIEARERLAGDASPEAKWILSRVELQGGSLQLASTLLAESGDFASDRGHEPEPGLYVGAVACRKCHPK